MKLDAEKIIANSCPYWEPGQTIIRALCEEFNSQTEPEPPLKVGDRVVLRGKIVNNPGSFVTVQIDEDEEFTFKPEAVEREEEAT